MMLATILMIKANPWQSVKDTSVSDTSISDTSISDTSISDTSADETNIKDTIVKNAKDLHLTDTSANDTSFKDAAVIELGTYGETFPVAEKNLLEVIRAKLQALFDTGKMKIHQQAILNKAKEQMNRPAPVKGIAKTVTPRSFAYDPSIVAPYDLKGPQGEVFCRQGTKVNPLDTRPLAHPLLFVDGDDAEQVFWAIKVYKAADPLHKPKIILVQGAPLDLSQKFGLPVYFDQHGQLVKKLGIGQVPARVSQDGKVLVVDEVDLKAEEYSPDPEGLK